MCIISRILQYRNRLPSFLYSIAAFADFGDEIGIRYGLKFDSGCPGLLSGQCHRFKGITRLDIIDTEIALGRLGVLMSKKFLHHVDVAGLCIDTLCKGFP